MLRLHGPVLERRTMSPASSSPGSPPTGCPRPTLHPPSRERRSAVTGGEEGQCRLVTAGEVQDPSPVNRSSAGTVPPTPRAQREATLLLGASSQVSLGEKQRPGWRPLGASLPRSLRQERGCLARWWAGGITERTGRGWEQRALGRAESGRLLGLQGREGPEDGTGQHWEPEGAGQHRREV